MGTNKETENKQTCLSPQDEEDETQTRTQRPAETEADRDEEGNNPLNTYRWLTGSKGEAQGHGTFEKLEKGAVNKWSKMQNWRKALSEDSGEKSPGTTTSKGESTTKMEKPSISRKNPFRRAQSEPPGALLHSVVSPSGTPTTPGTSGGESSDMAQKGKLRKYLLHVSQKLKRPKPQSRPNNIEEQASVPESLETPQSHKSSRLNKADTVENGTHSSLGCSINAEMPAPADTIPGSQNLSWSPPQDVPVWDINYCHLQDGQIMLPRDEPQMRARNRASSCLSSLSLQNLSESHTNLECSPDHIPPVSASNTKTLGGGVKAKIKRRLRGETQKKLSTAPVNATGLGQAGRTASRESLSIPVSVAESLDLGADRATVIRPVHSSILGEKYCFEVISSENIHCFGCSSAAERDRWIENLRRTAQPNKDNCERVENSLSLWVNEAKDLPPKRRYYCELHLDGTLFARTSSRVVEKLSHLCSSASEGAAGGAGGGQGGGQLFWGELFELDNLPRVSQVTLHLFREEDPKKKRHSRDEAVTHPLGSVALSLSDIKGRAFQEKWFPLVPYKSPGSGAKDQLGPQASLRVKTRFQNLLVLPIEKYKEFAEFVTMSYVEMCSSLEPLLNVKDKEELAGALVHVLQSIGKAKEFLIHLGSTEVQRLGENEALIFRENTLATKAIDEYMKLVGQKYLIDTLGDFISQLYSSSDSCEVDPRKCPASELSANQQNLKRTCSEVVQLITQTHSSFPVELNEVLSSWVSDCDERGRGEIGHRLITASLFLRFLCPAILSPSLFGLIQPYPEPSTLRTLTLTAKVLQNLANFTLFGEKEEYMLFMNEFLEQHWEQMRGFLQRVSNPDSELDMARFDGYVDLPLRLAVLHGLLVDIIAPMKQETIDHLQPLPSILNKITDHLGPEAPRITCSSAGDTKPTYVPPRDLAKYSPLNKSLQQLPTESRTGHRERDRPRKQVVRTQSVPTRPRHPPPKRQTSTEHLHTASQEPETSEAPQMDISSPRTYSCHKPPPAPVPWIKINQKEMNPTKTEQETSVLDKQLEELCELRLGVEQVAEQELEMAKRLEDFIVQSQDQNAQLQAEVQELRNLLTMREEQLASATFRLGVIEEEREEDERKLSVALAAAERMNVLEEQFAVLLKDIQHMNMAHNDGMRPPYIAT